METYDDECPMSPNPVPASPAVLKFQRVYEDYMHQIENSPNPPSAASALDSMWCELNAALCETDHYANL